MIKITNLILLSLIICLGLGIASFSLAQDSTTTTTTTDEQVSAQDLEVSDPTLLPNSPFYFLKEWIRSTKLAFTFNETKKAELESTFSNEKLVEIRKMTEDKIDPEKIKKAVEKYQKSIEKIKNITDKIKSNAEDNPDVNKFLEKFTNQQVMQEKILQKLETQVPTAVLEKIKAAREAHLERFQQVMTKLEDNKDKIAERVKNALQDGDKVNSKILDKIKEKMPEEVKQKIEDIRTEVVNRILEKVSRTNPPGVDCPNIATVDPATFCPNGRIKINKDDKGCTIGLECSTNTTSNENCKNLWWFNKNEATCQQKKFCGANISQSLKTFNTEEECTKALSSCISENGSGQKKSGDANKCCPKLVEQDQAQTGSIPGSILYKCVKPTVSGKPEINQKCINKKCQANGADCNFDHQCPPRTDIVNQQSCETDSNCPKIDPGDRPECAYYYRCINKKCTISCVPY